MVALALREADPAQAREAGLRTARVALRLAWVMWPALAATVVAGGVLLIWFVPPGSSLIGMPSGPWFLAKFAMVGLVLISSGLHTFLLSPQLRKAREAGTPEPNLARLKRSSAELATLSTVASVVVLILAVGATGAGP